MTDITAQQRTAPDDRWFLVDVTDASYSGQRDASVSKHAERTGAVLSITTNVAGTEALIKVRGAGSWIPPSGRLIRTFTPDDHHEAQALMYTPEWVQPDPKEARER